MEITWLGRTCFRIKGRDGTILTDPCPPSSGYKIGKQSASIVTYSRRADPEYSYSKAVADEPLILDAPGEYEHNNILVTALATRRADGQRNVMFFFELDGIRVGHLGLPTPSGPPGLDAIKDVDILLMPVGGGISLGATVAADVMTRFEPRIAIPMHFKADGETLALDPIDPFLKETGSQAAPQPKLQVTRSQLPTDLSVALLAPHS